MQGHYVCTLSTVSVVNGGDIVEEVHTDFTGVSNADEQTGRKRFRAASPLILDIISDFPGRSICLAKTVA